uniref:Uncharacterized protein n=1 Tax=Arundo donax TaxID=35708 RepID=A0A0A9HUJ9_ARUDO
MLNVHITETSYMWRTDRTTCTSVFCQVEQILHVSNIQICRTHQSSICPQESHIIGTQKMARIIRRTR